MAMFCQNAMLLGVKLKKESSMNCGHNKALSLILLGTLSFSSLANSLTSRVENLYDYALTKELKDEIKDLSNRNQLATGRPAFCPLNNTATYQKTVESLKSIVAVFQDDCFDGNKALIDELLTSSKTLEEELNKMAKETGKDPVTSTSSTEEENQIEVNGIPFSQFMNGINVLFSENKCTNLSKTPLLERSADIIQTFSQFGLYSASGVIVAYGGLAVSSILRFISNIFDKRFEFENESDIETFIKLNCAYYDVRNQVKSLEIFDIDTGVHHEDLKIASELSKQIKTKLKSIEDDKKKVLEIITEEQTESINSVDKDLEKLISPIYEKIKSPVADQPGKSAVYQQAEIIGELSFSVDILVSKLNPYITASNGPERFLNILFKKQLERLYAPEELMEFSVKDFNDLFLKDLASSFKRVLDTIAKKKDKVKEKFDENNELFVFSRIISYKDIRDYVEGKDFKKKEEELRGAQKVVDDIVTRLKAIIAKKEYTSDDSKDGGIREIIKSLDTVRNFVYGKYGKQFIEKMRDLSRSQNKNFNEYYKNIEENYFLNGTIPNKDSLYEDKVLNACVDANTGREIWVYSQKLSELGYDFLSTNSDIFGDPDNSDRKKIKAHNDSAILARRIMSARENGNPIKFYGKTMTIEEAEKYLEEEYGAVGIRKDYLGPVMMNVVSNRQKALRLQELIKKYNCESLSPFPR